MDSVKDKAHNFKPNCVVKVPTTLYDFFKAWLIFLRPYHELTNRQLDVAAAFLRHRYELGKVITDTKLLEENTMSDATKKKIKEECKMTNAHFQVIMGELKKHKFLLPTGINPRYIPSLKKDNNEFTFMLYFQIKK